MLRRGTTQCFEPTTPAVATLARRPRRSDHRVGETLQSSALSLSLSPGPAFPTADSCLPPPPTGDSKSRSQVGGPDDTEFHWLDSGSAPLPSRAHLGQVCTPKAPPSAQHRLRCSLRVLTGPTPPLPHFGASDVLSPNQVRSSPQKHVSKHASPPCSFGWHPCPPATT